MKPTDTERAAELLARCEQAIATITGTQAAASARLVEVETASAPLALKCALGVEAALARREELRREQAALEHDLRDLAVALDEANARRDVAADVAASANAHAALEHAERLATAYLEQSAKVDQALHDFVAAMEARTALHKQIAATRALDGDLLERLRCEVRLDVAARFAGATKYLRNVLTS